MLLWFRLIIPSFPAQIDDMRSRFSALSGWTKKKKKNEAEISTRAFPLESPSNNTEYNRN